MKKKLLSFLLLLLLAIAGYYVTVVAIARSETEEIVAAALASDRMKLELHDFTDEQLQALLKIQDPNFYNHAGVDLETPGAGVTTISQGLVKMYYFDNFKAGIPKIKQTLIARFAFDPLTPKETILKLFINEVYLGEKDGAPLKGFQNAAQYYFRKDFKQLTWEEYLSLVAMIRAPYRFHYIEQKEDNLNRVAKIKKVLSGEYVPVDNSDILYSGA